MVMIHLSRLTNWSIYNTYKYKNMYKRALVTNEVININESKKRKELEHRFKKVFMVFETFYKELYSRYTNLDRI